MISFTAILWDLSGPVTLPFVGFELPKAMFWIGIVYILFATVVAFWIGRPIITLSFTLGQPQVLEGCCPGPVYVDDELVPVGGVVTVASGASVTVQFSLQMHPGMDGPHHLTVPVQAGSVSTQLHVTGNFTAQA